MIEFIRDINQTLSAFKLEVRDSLAVSDLAAQQSNTP
jgi:hypothetical protein